jgi:hypothetical protein
LHTHTYTHTQTHTHTYLIHVHIAQIPHHALFIIRRSVIPAKGVEDASGTDESFGEVTKYVDMEAVFARKETLDSSVNGGGSLLLGL